MILGPRRGDRSSRWLVVLAGLLFTTAALVLLAPVLLSPVQGDDRYWYPEVAGRSGGSELEVVEWTFKDVPFDAGNSGRITVLAFLARRLVMLWVMDLAVATSTPVYVVQAGLKVLLLVLVLAAFLAFLRVLRTRDGNGDPVALSTRSVTLAMIMVTALVTAGAQGQGPVRNGWTAYPILTYGAPLAAIGSVALTVALARGAAQRGVWAHRLAALVAMALATALNVSYELYLVAVPLVLVAVLQQPLTGRGQVRRERRARRLVLASFLLAFAVVFGAIRAWVGYHCSRNSCYEGAQPELSGMTALTTMRNLLSPVPGGGRSELHADLLQAGLGARLPAWLPPSALALSSLLALSALGLVLAARSGSEPDPAQGPREARLLLLASLVPLAAAFGSALIMSLSPRAHVLVPTVGTPYRNSVATWTMLALAVAMAFAALLTARRSSTRTPLDGPIALAAFAVAVALLGGHAYAGNVAAVQAARNTPGTKVVADVQWEVVLGDPSEEGDERRCETLRALRGTVSSVMVKQRLVSGAEKAFQTYHGQAYCSKSSTP